MVHNLFPSGGDAPKQNGPVQLAREILDAVGEYIRDRFETWTPPASAVSIDRWCSSLYSHAWPIVRLLLGALFALMLALWLLVHIVELARALR